jgi:glutathione-regulated potassium-efflux system ancillary protein KefF
MTGMGGSPAVFCSYGTRQGFVLAMADILILAAHPDLAHSRVTRSVMRQAEALLESCSIALHDLYALYPDYDIDVAREQQALAAARVVVWVHPIHWYAMPPLMKLWLDEVFTFGWAYGPGGQALHGKALWLVTSTGGGEDAYQDSGHHGHAFEAFLLPYVQTARLTAMCWMPPLVLHAAHRASDEVLLAHAAAFASGLKAALDYTAPEDVRAAVVLAGDRPEVEG